MSEEQSGDEVRELTADEVAELEKLDDAIAKFEQQKRWSDMIRSILKKADLVQEPGQKVVLLREAGTLYLERSSNQAEAIKCFERLLEIDPTDVDAIERLKQMYEKRRDWEKLIRTMEREIELLPEDDQLIRYAEMAELATQRLRKPDVCIGLWQKVLEGDSENPSALANLAQLYERARQWEPLAEVLEKLVESDTDVASMKQQLQKLGMIYADKIGNDEGAIDAFRKLLELDPSDRRAQEQLKRRYVSLGAWDELETFYAANEKWDELIRIVERQAEAQDTAPGDRVALLFRAARLWEDKKGKADRAARVYEKILSADPDNVQAAEALTPIYESGNDARKLVSVLEVRFVAASDEASKIDLLGQIGRVFEERLRQPEVAFERYLEAFTLAPTHDDARADVERLAEEMDGWDRLVSGFESAIEGVSDPHQTIPIRLSYGQTLAKLDRIDEAIGQLELVYELESDNLAAIDGLGDLYARTERFRDLLDIYARRMELEQDPEVRLEIAYRRARLFAQELNDTGRAIGAFESIVDEYGVDQSEACRELEALYEVQSRWQDLAQLLERRVEAGPESHEELAALKFRLGFVNETQLADKSQAVDLYREVLSLMPEHDGAKTRLEELLDDAEVAAEASRVLEPVYEMTDQWGPYVHALRVQHRFAEEPQQKLALLTRVADTYFQHIGDGERGLSRSAKHSESCRPTPRRCSASSRSQGSRASSNRSRSSPATSRPTSRTSGSAARSGSRPPKSTRRSSATPRRRSPRTAKCSRRTRATSRFSPRSTPSIETESGGTSSSASCARAPKPARAPTTRSRCSARWRASARTSSTRPTRRLRSKTRSWSSTRPIAPRFTHWTTFSRAKASGATSRTTPSASSR